MATSNAAQGLGKRIREKRIALGLSQSRLSQMTGVPTSSITLIEGGKRYNITADSIVAIAGALRMTTDELLGFDLSAVPEIPTDALSPRVSQLENGLKQTRKEIADLGDLVREGFQEIQTRLPAPSAKTTPSVRKHR